jgi:hypothetical protein
MGVRAGDLGGHGMQPPRLIIPRMSGSGAASHRCDSGKGLHLVAKSHCLHPALEKESSPAYRVRSGSLLEKEWPVSLCSAYSTEVSPAD